MVAPPYECPTRIEGLLTRPSVRLIVATSSANESRPYWTEITSCPSACSVGITSLKHEPSAQMPWQKTIAGLVCADILHSFLLVRTESRILIVESCSLLGMRLCKGKSSFSPVWSLPGPSLRGLHYSFIEGRIAGNRSVLSRLNVLNGNDFRENCRSARLCAD